MPKIVSDLRVRPYVFKALQKVRWPFNLQKQLSTSVLRKRCSENMQQIYKKTPIPKCDFNKVVLRCIAFVMLQKFRKRYVRGGSRTTATSKMEHFVIIVNAWKLYVLLDLFKGHFVSFLFFIEPLLFKIFFANNFIIS